MSNPQLRERSTTIAVGDVIPDFVLPDQKRSPWKLSDHVKKGDVVLSFVPFAFTGVCSTEMKCIDSDLDTWGSKGATVVGVNCDSSAANNAWAEREGYRHTILSDIHRQLCKACGLYWADQNVSLRGTIVIGKNPDGVAKVKLVDARQIGEAISREKLIAML
ncbi:MAG: redoxin domain-containing protein [bacterium]